MSFKIKIASIGPASKLIMMDNVSNLSSLYPQVVDNLHRYSIEIVLADNEVDFAVDDEAEMFCRTVAEEIEKHVTIDEVYVCDTKLLWDGDDTVRESLILHFMNEKDLESAKSALTMIKLSQE